MKSVFGVVAGATIATLAGQPALSQENPPTDTTRYMAAVGLDYSTGKYGASKDTTVISVPFGLTAQADRFRFEFTIPYLSVKGPGSAFAGGVVVPGGSGVTTRSGLGDVNLGAAWLIHQDDSSFPAIEIAGSVKAPTAEVGLGTGKWDYGALVNISHSFSDQFMLFGSVGYQWLSDFKTIKLEDGVTGSIGANFKPSSRTSVGITANYRQEYYAGLGEQFSLTPYLLYDVSENWRISGYGLVGTTKSSPDIGAGFRVIFMR